MTRPPFLKSISQPQSWLEFVLQSVSLLVVYWLMLTILCLVFLAATPLLVIILLSEQASALTRVVRERLTRRSGAEKQHTLVLSRFSNIFSLLSDLVVRVALGVVLLLYTILFGIWRLRTFLYLRIIKVLKTIVYVDQIILFRLTNCFMKGC